jgi:hypothetical protein
MKCAAAMEAAGSSETSLGFYWAMLHLKSSPHFEFAHSLLMVRENICLYFNGFVGDWSVP